MTDFAKFCLIAFISLLMSLYSNTALCQNNLYKIDDSLFRYWNNAYKVIKDKKVLEMSDTLFLMSKKKHDVKAQCLALYLKVGHYYRNSNLPMLIQAKANLAKFAEKTPHKQYIFGAWNKIIDFYIDSHNYQIATEEIKQYQQTALRLKDDYGIGRGYLKLGDLYLYQRYSTLAIEQFLLAKEHYERSGSKEVYRAYQQLGSAYLQLKDYTTAEKYLKKSLAITQAGPTKFNYSEYTLLFILYTESGNLKEATKIKETLDNLMQNGLLASGNIHIAQGNLPNYYLLRNDTANAIESVRNLKDKQNDVKAAFYARIGDYRKALHYQKLFSQVRDSANAITQKNEHEYFFSHFHAQDIDRQSSDLSIINNLLKIKNMEEVQLHLAQEKQLSELQYQNQQDLLEMAQENSRRQEDAIKHKQKEIKRINANAAYKSKITTFSVISISLLSVFLLFYIVLLRRHADRLKQKREEADSARLKAQQANALKSAFLQNVNQEIRTPLNGIVGFNDLLNDSLDISEDERSEILRQIHSNTDMLLNLLDEIMEMSKLETSNYTLKLEDVSVTTICTKAAELTKNNCPPHVQLKIHSQCPDFPIHTDGTYIVKVLCQLLLNAYKYTPQGTVGILYEQYAGSAFIAISYGHENLEETVHGHIHEHLDRLTRPQAALGFGLSLSQRMITALNGKFFHDESFTGGVRLIIQFPGHSNKAEKQVS